jgi:hypothetical protein
MLLQVTEYYRPHCPCAAGHCACAHARQLDRGSFSVAKWDAESTRELVERILTVGTIPCVSTTYWTCPPTLMSQRYFTALGTQPVFPS